MPRFRFVLFLLCAALVLLAAGCRHDTEEVSPETASSDLEDVQDATEPSIITLVRSETSSDAVTKAAVELRKTLEAAGVPVDLKTDWYKPDEDMKRYPGEIHIGKTNRPESEQIYAQMKEADELLDYLIRADGILTGNYDNI